VYSWPGLVLLTLFTFGCGKVDNPDAEREEVFHLGLSAPPATLDPAHARDQTIAWLTQQLYEGLVRLDTALQPAPALARRWAVSPDGRTYTFTLRRDAWFHRDACFGADTARRRVVGADVVASLTRLVTPATASPGAWLLSGRVVGADAVQQGRASAVSGLRAPDDSTVVIALERPSAAFLSLLVMPYAYVVAPEAVARYGRGLGQHPVGSGPFYLHRAEPEALLLRRHTDYYEPVGPRAIYARVLRSRLTALRELLRGRLDLIDGLDPSIKDDVLGPQGQLQPHYAGRVRLVTAPALTTEYLGFNLADTASPWRDARLRRAVAHAIDRAALVRYLRNGLGTPARGLLPLGLPGYAPEALSAPDYDPAAARRLLAEAGHPGGRGLPPLELLTGPSYRAQGELIQSQLGEVGISVAVEVVEGAAAREQIAHGRARAWRASWQADYPAAENFLGLFYGPQAAPAGPNTTRYTDAAFDAGYRRLLEAPATAPAEFAAQVAALEQQLVRDQPAVFLYHYRLVRLVHPRVSGLHHSPLELLLDLRRVQLAPAETSSIPSTTPHGQAHEPRP